MIVVPAMELVTETGKELELVEKNNSQLFSELSSSLAARELL